MGYGMEIKAFGENVAEYLLKMFIVNFKASFFKAGLIQCKEKVSMSSISGRCCRCSHEPLIPYLAKISDLYPLAILKVDKLKDGSMAVDGEVGGNLLRGE